MVVVLKANKKQTLYELIVVSIFRHTRIDYPVQGLFLLFKEAIKICLKKHQYTKIKRIVGKSKNLETQLFG